jgi:hypothetical protein
MGGGQFLMCKRKEGVAPRRPPRSSPDFRRATPTAEEARRGAAMGGVGVGGAAQLERRGGRIANNI